MAGRGWGKAPPGGPPQRSGRVRGALAREDGDELEEDRALVRPDPRGAVYRVARWCSQAEQLARAYLVDAEDVLREVRSLVDQGVREGMLLGQIVDTNSSWIGEQLALVGIDSLFQVKVGDNFDRMDLTIRHALTP